jgi:hypothetical protein
MPTRNPLPVWHLLSDRVSSGEKDPRQRESTQFRLAAVGVFATGGKELGLTEKPCES